MKPSDMPYFDTLPRVFKLPLSSLLSLLRSPSYGVAYEKVG